MRESRKYDHLKFACMLDDGPASTHFSDFLLVHNCLPDLHFAQIDISSSLVGIALRHPLLLNAITGGAPQVTQINADIAELARLTGSPMAVGSQYAGLENPEVIESYQIVRKVNPDGVIFANLGAHTTPDQAQNAVEMIEAQAIQIHLNTAQEMIMEEGDRNFSGYLSNIENIVKKVNVPVIVKEVGCGIAAEQARSLADAGVRAIDIGGAGGTNFIAIEAARLKRDVSSDFLSWGIPTALSAVEVFSAIPKTMEVVISGGIRTPLEAVKSLVLGAVSVGIASPIIKLITRDGIEQAARWIDNFLYEMRVFMLLTGSDNIQQLKQKPVIVSGFSRDWLIARGIDVASYANRGRRG